MKVVVTGGAGFIGSHVTDALIERGDRVVVIDNLSTGRVDNLAGALSHGTVDVVEADIASERARATVTSFCPEAILLLAAQPSVKISMQDPAQDARVNVVGMIALLEAAVAAGTSKAVLAASGGTIYGNVSPDDLPVRESYRGRPDSFYGLTKRLGVDYLRLYRRYRGLDSAALGLGNVYGERQDPLGEAGVVAIFLNRLRHGQDCVIHGTGQTTRDFVHVQDVARAFVQAATSGSGLINIGTGREISVTEVHTALARHFEGAAPPVHGPALPGEVLRVSLDVTRARERLGWMPEIGFELGIERLVQSFSSGRGVLA